MYSTSQTMTFATQMPSEAFLLGLATNSTPASCADQLEAHHHLVASCEERLRILRQLLHMTSDSCSRRNFGSGNAMAIPSQLDSPSPSERRHQERLQARTKLAFMKERKAQFANCSLAQGLGGKQARRVSSFTETEPSRTPQVAACEEEDDSTICMPVSYTSPQEEGMLDLEDIDDIFDDESSCEEDSFEEPVHPVAQQGQTPMTPQLRRQVSEASFGGLLRNRRQNTSPRNPTPKETGLSSWDDVSSIATLSRIGSFEPEPLPMGFSPIPLVIYVPTPKDEEDDLEPLRIFPSQGFPSLSNVSNGVL